MAHTLEKADATQYEDVAVTKSDSSSQDDILNEFSPEEIKRIIRKIDMRLVSVVGILYCISLMDRTNLAAANIAGMNVELDLNTKMRYSIVTLVFFTTYVVFQFPSTIVIRYLGPRNHLAAITLMWGAVMIGMGFVQDWQQLAALRIILGILEAGFFPGCVYLLSTWYVRYDMHKRYSVFYFIGSLASALAGILAYGLMQLDGTAGLTGWRWIFILEGVITCVFAIVGYFLIVNFPDSGKVNWKFLSAKELRYIVARVNADRGDANAEPWNLKKFLEGGLDLKVHGFAMIFGLTTTVSYALAYFLPVILRGGMGFSVAKAQCLVAPPYGAAGIVMWLTGAFGDKYHLRGPVIAFNSILAIIGLPLIGWTESVGVRYFGVFLVCIGANGNIPAAMAYQANNIRGHWKRAFCSALLVGWGGLGGIIGSLVFREQDTPQYHPGLWACIASQLLILLMVGALSVKFVGDNRKADRGELVIEDGEREGFRYTL
ncbi:major facilitator superfamily transporter [Aulographum hederae CBS 113979]|uniref:Major facilitator superfamily transporter n=1 Tax=Aulographum hederae CBS 113979 TaxID=1176131 RepID=A0A6G1GYS7_9PEZI|nr:major facilitator superfamily transporter [Aulographum hederae CBS 113979]